MLPKLHAVVAAALPAELQANGIDGLAAGLQVVLEVVELEEASEVPRDPDDLLGDPAGVESLLSFCRRVRKVLARFGSLMMSPALGARTPSGADGSSLSISAKLGDAPRIVFSDACH